MISLLAAATSWQKRKSAQLSRHTMRISLLVLAVCSGPAAAEDWAPLDQDAIWQALSDHTLDYDNAWQEFRASGRTLYNAGADSWGRWAARGDQYCSQWPPSDAWVCYDVE